MTAPKRYSREELDAVADRVRAREAAEQAEWRKVHHRCMDREVTLIRKVATARQEIERLTAEVDERTQERDVLQASVDRALTRPTVGALLDRARDLVDETDRLRAELDGIRAVLDDLVNDGAVIVARDGGRDCVRCGLEIQRGHAYTHDLSDPSGDSLIHVRCPLPDEVPPQTGEDHG